MKQDSANTGQIEGRLRILLRERGARIESSRPLAAARLFVGRPVQQVLHTLPLLFNVCGQAQAVAAIRAIESAAQQTAAQDVEQARDRLVALETLREHLWRVLLDWPTFVERQPQQAALANLMAVLQSLKNQIDPLKRLLTHPGLQSCSGSPTRVQDGLEALRQQLEQHIFGCPLGQWLNASLDELHDWIAATDTDSARLLRLVCEQQWESLGRSGVAPMREIDDTFIAEQLDGHRADDFIAQPDFGGQALDTGPLSRLQDHPLLQAVEQAHGRGLLLRLLARLLEIALLADSLDQAPLNGRTVQGLAAVEAARGRLWHRVQLDGDRTVDYRILAPTEWNFHANGCAVEALSSLDLADPQRALQQAKLLVHAIDPCVGYELEVEKGHA